MNIFQSSFKVYKEPGFIPCASIIPRITKTIFTQYFFSSDTQLFRPCSNEVPKSMFLAEIWRILEFVFESFHFLVVKLPIYLNRHVFIMWCSLTGLGCRAVYPPAETFGGLALSSLAFGMKVLASLETSSGVGAFFLLCPLFYLFIYLFIYLFSSSTRLNYCLQDR